MKGFTQTVLFLGVAATMYGKLCMADCNTNPPCSGQGTCGTGNKCTCNDGYIGDSCEQVDPCLSDPCNGQGTCAPDTSDPPKDVCTCNAGYGGDKCDLAPKCTDDTACLNDGTCDKSSGQYLCKCAPGYGGDTCNEISCTNNPCLNEGACEVKDGNIECTCAPGWRGDRCADASGAGAISVHFLLLTVVAVLAKLNLN